MKRYAPAYYKDFSCIADKCRHSCCVGWEIDVDKKTLGKYKKLRDGYGEMILASIDTRDTPHFSLCGDERCPHLDERGLCRIISHYGEGCLCDICREHPRFYNDTAKGREVGLGMACEEACRLILTAKDYTAVCEIGKEKGRARRPSFNALPERERIYSILLDDSLAYPERLEKIADAYGISPPDDTKCRERLASLEYMTEENRARFAGAFSAEPSTPQEIQPLLCRALAYFVFRHVTVAKSMEDLRMAVGFSLLCERLLCSLVKAENAFGLDAFCDRARILSEELEYSEENTRALMIFSIQKNRF
ncbi:MAG: hypothetical protein E7609_07020 [Ruminococcaceae bacterium]|nr:hypothetical protein [Oscillospiraceae bacterium]